MAIDDLGRAHAVDLLLDSGLPVRPNRYPHARALLGPRYALLRPGFRQARPRRDQNRIFLCFGGSDPGGMTLRAAQALAQEPYALDIVAGYANADAAALRELCAAHPGWRLFVDHPHPEALMAQAALGVGAGGGMMWERAAMGLPSVVVSIADNQRGVCAAMDAGRAIAYLGPQQDVTGAALRGAVARLMRDTPARDAMGKTARRLVNPRGAMRVADAMRRLAP
jgi:spore coat polysaccharide biosynthesis predicted glycosyltransferase SpsG